MIAHLRSEDMALVVGPWLSVSIHAQGTAVHSPDAEDGDQQIRVLRFLPTNPTGSSVQDSMKTTAMVALLSEDSPSGDEVVAVKRARRSVGGV